MIISGNILKRRKDTQAYLTSIFILDATFLFPETTPRVCLLIFCRARHHYVVTIRRRTHKSQCNLDFFLHAIQSDIRGLIIR
jgi:hypothetical protein